MYPPELVTDVGRFEHWNSDIIDDLPEVQYEAVMASDAGVAQWVAKIVGHSLSLSVLALTVPTEQVRILLCGRRSSRSRINRETGRENCFHPTNTLW